MIKRHPPLSGMLQRGLLLCLFVLPIGCATTAAGQPENTVAEASVDFSTWLADLKAEARSSGISDSTVELAFADVTSPLDRVLELDRSQPEFMQTFSGYMQNRMSQQRIERADFFRAELLAALRIIDDGHIAADRMTGSWAGAMGQCQFMPSTFASYARDGDGDGKIDIWGSVPDVMTSAANYLSRAGWKEGERWGREVLLPPGFDFALSGTGVRKSVTEWDALGVRRADGTPLGTAAMEASVIVPAGANGPAFLAYDNFRTTMVWNRSTFYAISVGHLADRFMGEPDIQHMPATAEQALARNDVMEMQELLNRLGHDVGEPDGILGTRTREGVRLFQLANDIPADGYASHDMLLALREQLSTR
jgi:membrane-bound lytic murein transglycosylase B